MAIEEDREGITTGLFGCNLWSGCGAAPTTKRRKLAPWSGDGVGDADGSGSCNSRHGGEVQRTSVDWSALPQPALYLIMEKKGLLPGDHADLFSMSLVCKSWRSVFRDYRRETPSSMPPLLLHTDTSNDDLFGTECYSFMERRRFLRSEAPFPWPLQNAAVYSVSYGYWLVKYYGRDDIFLVDPCCSNSSPAARIDLPAMRPFHYMGYPVMTAPPTSPDCLIVSLHPKSMHCCRPGDTQWTTYKFCEDRDWRYMGLVTGSVDPHPAVVVEGKVSELAARVGLVPDQAAVLEGKVYVLAGNGDLVIVDLLSPRPTFTVLEEIQGLPPEREDSREVPHPAKLVESGGQILLIAPVVGGRPIYPHAMLLGFAVYRLDLPERRWVRLNSLGDRIQLIDSHVCPIFHTSRQWLASEFVMAVLNFVSLFTIFLERSAKFLPAL